MHHSLAKQDTLVANVTAEMLTVNEISRSCISLINLQPVHKNAHYRPDGYSLSATETFQIFENWKPLKKLAQQHNLSCAFCGNCYTFRFTDVNLPTPQSISVRKIIFLFTFRIFQCTFSKRFFYQN
jgi:Uncharacterized protein conserved in archaea